MNSSTKWIVLCVLLASFSPGFALDFVYPVGIGGNQPTLSFPNSNGYRISNDFRGSSGHSGVDLANGIEGGEVRAITSGTIDRVIPESQSFGFGNLVVVRHDLAFRATPLYSFYAHLKEGTVGVVAGNPISTGAKIGEADCTGATRGSGICSNNKSGPHLHFAVKNNNNIGCAYIAQGSCNSGDSFFNYCEPITFIETGACISGADNATFVLAETPTRLVNIPDAGPSISAPISFPLAGEIVDIALFFQFTHECEQNLNMHLRSPDGKVVHVMARGLMRCSHTPQVFISINTEISGPSFFGGRNPQGTWTLTVQDDVGGDVGTFDTWKLSIAVKQ